MILYTLTGTITFADLKITSVDKLSYVIIKKLEQLHPGERNLDEAQIKIDKDGIFYRVNVPA